MTIKTGAIWTAVEKACEREDFRPNPGKLCSWCSFHDHCPAQGGTLPDLLQVTPKPDVPQPESPQQVLV
jgi:putative RecB family exonuclease